MAPSRRRRSASPRSAPVDDAELGEKSGVAERDLAPLLDRADDALAGRRSRNPSTGGECDVALGRGRDDRARQRMLARALDAGGEAQHLGFVEARPPATTATTFGLPSVSVPVLSTTSVSTFSMRSSASAFLIRTPALRAAADADHDRHRRGEAERAGAGDDQHGDARRPGRRRSAARGPNDRPGREGQRARPAITAGTNQPAT